MSRFSIPRPQLVSRVLLIIGLVLVVAPALVPVDPVLHHETGPGTGANEAQLAQQGVRVVAYENLSDRGQELYRQTLLNGGRYTVAVGEGADDFNYTVETDDEERTDRPPVRRPGDRPQLIAIERPPNSSLPPADEPVEMARERQQRRQEAESSPEENESTNRTTPSAEEVRERVSRYDLMITRQDTPSLTATSNLVRLLSVILGVVALGVGGYLGSKP